MEALERRATFLLLTVAIVLVLNRPAEFTSERGEGWQVVVYVLSLVCLAAAGFLLAVAIASPGIIELARDRRERVMFLAFALVVAALVAIVILRVYATYYLHRHGLS